MNPRGILMQVTKSVLIGYLFLGPADPSAQSPDQQPAAVLELGASPLRSLTGGGWSFGPTVAVEVEPIENWLKLEAGVAPFFARHSTKWDTDLIFKKPWTLSPKAEFMLGVGPEWIHTSLNNMVSNSVGGEVALDFMFWPKGKHRFGWYVEPAYDYDFGRGHEQSKAWGLRWSPALCILIWSMLTRVAVEELKKLPSFRKNEFVFPSKETHPAIRKAHI